MRLLTNDKPFDIDKVISEARRHRTLTSLARACDMRLQRLQQQLEKRGKLEEVSKILKRWCK